MQRKILKQIGPYSIYDVGYCPPVSDLRGCYLVEIAPPITPNPKAGGRDILYGFGILDVEARKDAIDQATTYIQKEL